MDLNTEFLKKKQLRDTKNAVHLFLYLVWHLRRPPNSTRKILEVINTLSKMRLTEQNKLSIYQFTHSKNIPALHSDKKLCDELDREHKRLHQKTEEVPRRQKDSLCSRICRINVVKITAPPKSITNLMKSQSKISMTFFTIEQNSPKIHMKSKCQSHPEQKEQCWWDYHIKFQAV